LEKILVVDDQVEVLEYLTELLCQSGYKVTACGDTTAALATIEKEGDRIGLAILDLDLGQGSDDGLVLLRDIKERQRDLPVIILTGKGGTQSAVQAIKLGAVDFLEKGAYLPASLTASVKKADKFLKIVRENRCLRAETARLRRKTDYYRELSRLKRRIVGTSKTLQKCLSEADAVAAVPRPVLIRGERGTGKELVAAYIHQKSPRAEGPFITVNCAALSGNLLESEMFGYEKGAFTGSEGRKPGRFELADGGTLFLDEIGNMAADFQDLILRAVEYQRFERVQGTETIEVDVRILAATNADIEAMMESGGFRRDLYDRLAFKEIRVPPLRERVEDIPTLVKYFLGELSREVPSLGGKEFTRAAIKALQGMPWPGNVRQLKNTVERLALETPGSGIDAGDLASDADVRRSEEGDFHEKTENFQKTLISDALSSSGNNQKGAAEALGLTYDQFRHYYRKFGFKNA
jgi:DNA-binding NtrC family response regulator